MKNFDDVHLKIFTANLPHTKGNTSPTNAQHFRVSTSSAKLK